jgi:hypothetical protein
MHLVVVGLAVGAVGREAGFSLPVTRLLAGVYDRVIFRYLIRCG